MPNRRGSARFRALDTIATEASHDSLQRCHDSLQSRHKAVSKELGQEIDFLWTVDMNPRHSVLIGYAPFDAGSY